MDEHKLTQSNVTTLVDQGLQLHRRANYEAALKLYSAASEMVHPPSADLCHLMGEAHYRLGQFQQGLIWINRAIASAPNSVYFNTRAVMLSDMGHLLQAQQDLTQSIKLEPGYAAAWINLSNVYRKQRNFKKARESCQKALELMPNSTEAINAQGALLMETGKLEDAIICFNQLLAKDSTHYPALKNRAKIWSAQKNWVLAKPELDQLFPRANDIEVAQLLVEASFVLGQIPDAVRPFQATLSWMNGTQRKDYLADHASIVRMLEIAKYLSQQGRVAESADLYQKAIEVIPDNPLFLNNYAVTQFDQTFFDKAIEVLKKLLTITETNSQARNNLAVALIMCGRSEEAIAELEKTLELDPDFLPAAGWLIKEKNRICSWSNLVALREKVGGLLDNPAQVHSVNTFILLGNYDDPKRTLPWAIKNATENFSNLGVRELPVSGKGRKHARIKVAYFSVDFRNHPVSHLTAPLYALHNREKFEIFVYSYGPDDKHPVRERIKNGAEHFIDLQNKSVPEMVERIKKDEIDILIDLSGNTRGNKSIVFGYRPAPVQAHWLGFIGTMGSEYYDYIIADHYVAPAGADEWFAENLVRMPHCFQINDVGRPPLDPHIKRSDHGLPDDAVVFIDFNQSFKIQPEMFAAWVQILKAVPNSVLWLADGHEAYLRNIKLHWADAGLAPERLIIAPRVSSELNVSRYQLADLFLDVFPYTSGTTASDALWGGCPLLALSGKSMIARMSASLLTAAELPELIVESVEAYVEKAIELARNPEELKRMRRHLREKREQLPLFNANEFVHDLERAYTEMARLAWSGDEPRPIDVNALAKV